MKAVQVGSNTNTPYEGKSAVVRISSPHHSFQTAAYDYLISLSYTKCHEARYSLPKSGRIYKGASLHSQPQTLIGPSLLSTS